MVEWKRWGGGASPLGVNVACNMAKSTLRRINSKHHAGAQGLSPPTPFLVAAISCFFRKVAAEFRFDPKEVAACWPLVLLSQLQFIITQPACLYCSIILC